MPILIGDCAFAYFLSCLQVARRVAPFITAMQILQMVGGMIVTGVAAHTQIMAPANVDPRSVCDIDPANYRLGGALYLSYLILFSILFGNLYLTKDRRSKEKRESKTIQSIIRCPPNFHPSMDVGDAAGHFHGDVSRRASRVDGTATSSPALPSAPNKPLPSIPLERETKKDM